MMGGRFFGTVAMAVCLLATAVLGAGAQETPTAADPVRPPAVSHDTVGKEACLVCHAIGAAPITDVPADHEARGNETCLWCHAPDSPMLTVQVSPVSHDTVGKEACLVCHAIGATPITDVPADHEGRANETCLWCHAEPGGGSGVS